MENQQTDFGNTQTTIGDDLLVRKAWLGIGMDIDQIRDQAVRIKDRIKANNNRLEIRIITKTRDGKDNIRLEIIPCVYLGEGVEHGDYGDPIVTMDCSDLGKSADTILDIVWSEHGKDVSRMYNQHQFGTLYCSIKEWIGGDDIWTIKEWLGFDDVPEEKEIRYLVQCQYGEGSVFEADTVNRLYLDKGDAMDDLAVTEENVYIEFSNKYDKYSIEPKWSPDRTRCEINTYDGNGEVADTWVGRIEAMETLTGFKA